MNGPNTSGLLGPGLSAPVTPAVFSQVMPGTCIRSHNYSIMYQKSNVREGNIPKSGAPGGENSLRGGCSGLGTGRGPGRGQGQGLKKKPPPWAIDQGGVGNGGPGPPVLGPRRPRNEHYSLPR